MDPGMDRQESRGHALAMASMTSSARIAGVRRVWRDVRNGRIDMVRKRPSASSGRTREMSSEWSRVQRSRSERIRCGSVEPTIEMSRS